MPEQTRYETEWDLELFCYDEWQYEGFGLSKDQFDSRYAVIKAQWPTISIRITERIIDNDRYKQ